MSGAENSEKPADPLAPKRAVVMPRGRRKGELAAVALEKLVLPVLRGKKDGTIVIAALAGYGTTTALRHLRAVLPGDLSISFCDADNDNQTNPGARWLIMGVAADAFALMKAVHVFQLCPWTLDDCLEYLIAVHREHCASVYERLQKDEALGSLKGSPQLLTRAMDAMARDASLAGAWDALRSELFQIIPGPIDRDRLINSPSSPRTEEHQRWWRHVVVRQIIRADETVETLCAGIIPDWLNQMQPRDVIRQIGLAIAQRPTGLQCLEDVVRVHPASGCVPMAAGILLAVDPNWRPPVTSEINLRYAILSDATWPARELPNAYLHGANLIRADLRKSSLPHCDAVSVNLTRAKLADARFEKAKLQSGIFRLADLSRANFCGADLNGADLEEANLSEARICSASMANANLKNANCQGTDFSSSTFFQGCLEGADFSGARFNHANLNAVNLTEAIWTNAIFAQAWVTKCNLEGLELPGAMFDGVNFTGSLLTGSIMPGGYFRGAKFCQAGLAEIEWENADLRGADFTNASFHMGSSRSGLVGSTIASEGSRTGFYTDDFDEQNFKSPEEIRKANLRAANLIGAKVDGTDFYLVDLRDAKYSREQAAHFARCGAILYSRVK